MIYTVVIEDHALSRSYDLAPRPSPPPLPSISSTGDTLEDLLPGEGDGGERGAEETINHTILPAACTGRCKTFAWAAIT
jgi:hypothetical protein